MTKEKLLIIAYCFQKPSEFLSLKYIDGFFFLFRKSCWVVATLLLFLLVLGIAWYLLPFLHLFVFQWVPVLIAFDVSCIYSTLQLCPLQKKRYIIHSFQCTSSGNKSSVFAGLSRYLFLFHAIRIVLPVMVFLVGKFFFSFFQILEDIIPASLCP